MNLHISSNDKFITGFIENQQQFAQSTKNKYYVIGDYRSDKIEIPDSDVAVVSIKELKQFMRQCKFTNCNQVIFHALPTKYRKHLLHIIPIHIKVTWIFYGYEYYHRRDTIEKYLEKYTRSFYRSWSNPHLLWQWAHRKVDRLRGETERFSKELQRIDRFAHWNPTEYRMIQDRFKLTDIEYLPFSMGLPVHHLVSEPEYEYMLLGHSGALTVNHLDGIEIIPLSIIDRLHRIIIPLSYGAGKTYKKKVKHAALEKFGQKVLFLEKHLDRKTYFNLLSRVKLAWMPQIRAMGGGNILFCLKNNIPIVFTPQSIIHTFLVDKGFIVYSSDEVHYEIPLLTKKQKVNNQKLFEIYFGTKVIQQQYQNLLSPF